MAKAKRKKPKVKVGIPTPLERPRVAYVVRDWHPTDGAFDCGFTFDQDVALTYIGKMSPRGGKYYVGLRLEVGRLAVIGEYTP